MFNDKFFDDLFNETNDMVNEPLLRLGSGSSHSPNSYPSASSDCPSFSLNGGVGLDGPDLFFTSSQDGNEPKSKQGSLEMEDVHSDKPKHRRKTKLESDTAEIKKQVRAEKNKKYAKESRDRKRKYVEDLEAQIETLKSELEKCKARLKEYELIEKYKKSLGNEWYDMLAKVYQDLNSQNQSAANNTSFTQSFKKAFCQAVEEQQKVLEMQTKSIVETMLPLPTRVSMWMAEHNVDITKPEKVIQAFGTILSGEQVKTLSDYMQIADPTGKFRKENSLFVAGCSRKIKSALKELVSAYKKLKLLLLKIKNHVSSNDMPLYTPYIVEMMARVGTQLAATPAVANSGICQLLEDMSIAKEEEDYKEAEIKA
eukprot:TRINITY_DN5978_c0_g1_i2.p1 TRINITY_DN5978_c0_g1~~TRINITY_DN5978_c0_g1_i2.p1  ORF type:complete len:369 (-),score=127.58 TRINITY_DN5978_c0_g1_i2:123-1229(-)